MVRNYSNTAVETALSGAINSSVTTIGVGSNTGYPSPPYSIIIDPGTPSEEICEVTDVAGTSWTVTRGVDGTPATSHSAGAVVVHGVSARDFREVNEHIDDTTNVHGIASTSNLVTVAGSQTLTNKTLTSPVLNSPTIVNFANATHTHTSDATGGAIASGGAWYGPSTTQASSFTIGTSEVNMPGLAMSYTAPALWPTGATKLLYSLTVQAAGADNPGAPPQLQIYVRDNGALVSPTPAGGVPFRVLIARSVSASSSCEWTTSLPGVGTSRSITVGFASSEPSFNVSLYHATLRIQAI